MIPTPTTHSLSTFFLTVAFDLACEFLVSRVTFHAESSDAIRFDSSALFLLVLTTSFQEFLRI